MVDRNLSLSNGAVGIFPIMTIYLAHPFASDPVGHTTRVRRIARRLALEGHLPLSPHLLLGPILHENRERDLAIALCRRMVGLADEVHVFGLETDGMRLEVEEALRLGKVVRRFDGP